MAKLLEKGGTQAKNSIGCQISKAGEVEMRYAKPGTGARA